VVAVSYLIEIFLVKPNFGEVLYHAVVPQFSGVESVLVATGILGATVMPHAIYLHSALTQDRIIVKNPKQQKMLFRYEIIDVVVAMGAASLINMAMLIMAATTFHQKGMANVGTIEQAYQTLEPLLGSAAKIFFGISLLASGLSSSSVGTMAGQVIMQGFLHRHITPWLRRLVTMLPSLIVIAVGFDPTRTLVISQVILSFGLPFAVIPLVMFTRRKDLMGHLVNRPITTYLATLAAALILSLNMFLIYQLTFGR
jgi:manganese transport protein